MKTLGWNCRGICNASIVRALKAQIKGSKPDIAFLCETKANLIRMDFVKSSIGFDESIVVESKGSVGGLCMMWKAGIFAHCIEFNKNLIAIRVSDPICDWIMVGFYGPPYPAKKKEAWENLSALLNSFQGPWICLGDFNFIINENESSNKKSGESSAPNYLKELMLEFGAIDLGFLGSSLGRKVDGEI